MKLNCKPVDAFDKAILYAKMVEALPRLVKRNGITYYLNLECAKVSYKKRKVVLKEYVCDNTFEAIAKMLDFLKIEY